jgi:predicted RNase H-like HicB family nuclease
MKDYHINIFYSEEDVSYIADIPDFEMCSAHGETPEAALREVLIARDALIEVMREKGQAVPEPR